MTEEITILMATAASIGLFHTLLGPDHYLPFIVMSKSGKWSLLKTTLVTFICGIGHVLGSIALGLIGIGLGIGVAQLEIIESFRGGIAAWALIAFGLIYLVWGIRRGQKKRSHSHLHKHTGGLVHEHNHHHITEHSHVHEKQESVNVTPWVLFTIFILGPCEPLIPLLMFPAANSNIFGLILVIAIFSAVTIITMLTVVLVSTFGINLIPAKRIEPYMHAFSGATIMLCGIAIQFLGL